MAKVAWILGAAGPNAATALVGTLPPAALARLFGARHPRVRQVRIRFHDPVGERIFPAATDAMVVLGWLRPEAFLGGGILAFLGIAGLVALVGFAVVDHDGVRSERPHRGLDVVDDHRLGVQHRRLILEDLDAGLEQLFVGRAPGHPHRRLVDLRAGHQDADPDAALGGVLQRLDERRARREVRRGQVDPLARGEHLRVDVLRRRDHLVQSVLRVNPRAAGGGELVRRLRRKQGGERLQVVLVVVERLVFGDAEPPPRFLGLEAPPS